VAAGSAWIDFEPSIDPLENAPRSPPNLNRQTSTAKPQPPNLNRQTSTAKPQPIEPKPTKIQPPQVPATEPTPAKLQPIEQSSLHPASLQPGLRTQSATSGCKFAPISAASSLQSLERSPRTTIARKIVRAFDHRNLVQWDLACQTHVLSLTSPAAASQPRAKQTQSRVFQKNPNGKPKPRLGATPDLVCSSSGAAAGWHHFRLPPRPVKGYRNLRRARRATVASGQGATLPTRVPQLLSPQAVPQAT
jgi:hypothetical protein